MLCGAFPSGQKLKNITCILRAGKTTQYNAFWQIAWPNCVLKFKIMSSLKKDFTHKKMKTLPISKNCFPNHRLATQIIAAVSSLVEVNTVHIPTAVFLDIRLALFSDFHSATGTFLMTL